MNARSVAAAVVAVASSSQAFALWLGIPDFRQVVQEADVCLYGRVTLARELREGADRGHSHFACLAVLEVEYCLFGPHEEGEHITVYYGDSVVDDTSLAPRERCVLFLNRLSPPLVGYASPVMHWGVFKIAKDNSIRMPKRLGDPPRLREAGDTSEFFDEIRYVRGPEITVRPTKPSFRWDEPVTLEATFTNPSFEGREMKLLFAPPPLAEYSYADQYLSARGLPICGPVSREAEDPKPLEVVLPAHGTVTRNVTVHPHFRDRAEYDPASIAFIALEYSTDCVQNVEGAWKGSAFSGPAPVRIVCHGADFARGLADAGERYAFSLEIGGEKVSPGGRALVSVQVLHREPPADEPARPPAQPAVTGSRAVRQAFRFDRWGRQLRLPKDRLAALAAGLRVTRNGRPIETRPPDPRARTWLPGFMESARSAQEGQVGAPAWVSHSVRIDLAGYFDLTQPGGYTVRLVVPPEETGEKRSLASNVIEFTVAAPAPAEE